MKFSKDYFSDLRSDSVTLNIAKIRSHILELCERRGGCATQSDRFMYKYYHNNGPLLWIDRYGIDMKVDTLLKYIDGVEEIGFSKSAFFYREIRDDVNRFRNLDFKGGNNSINEVFARLEYYLTKSYLRYVTGQRFGFVNPQIIFNKIDSAEHSTPQRLLYRRLFDINTELPDSNFFSQAIRIVSQRDYYAFFHEVQPRDSLYFRLKNELQKSLSEDYRIKLICNLERSRWREEEYLSMGKKYIIVNIPSFHLYAYGGDTLLYMRIGCGSYKTKTPLLTSAIERMDVNPVWNIPMSIIKNEVSQHAGDTSYFSRNKYYIVRRENGERVPVTEVSPAMLRSGEYRVSQESGDGNSLGRIIFRFANDFSVFLHDTSNRNVFARTNRGVSHGCVRVQRPFDLALYLLDDPDEWLVDRLRISMDIMPQTKRGIEYIRTQENNRKLINSISVNPHVPLFITYFTIYPDNKGQLTSYPDVYGYDEVIHQNIKLFMN